MVILLDLPLAEVVASLVFPDGEPHPLPGGEPYLLLAGPGVRVRLALSGRAVDELVALQLLVEAAESLRERIEGQGRHRA